MNYQLPDIDQTWVQYVGHTTILYRRFNGAPGFISTFCGIINHEEAHARHTATVKRARRVKRLWRIGKYFSFSRTILLRELYA